MTAAPIGTVPRAPAGVLALLVLLGAGLGACAQKGDFGRAAPGAWNDALGATGALARTVRDEPASGFAFTDDEREQRDRAWRFLMPAQERTFLDGLLANLTRTGILPASWRPADPAIYRDALTGTAFRSPASRYRRLSEDAVADARLIPAFAAVAARVAAADGVRLRGLAHVRTLEADEARQAALRVAENRCLVAWVRFEAGARATAYAYALEHLVIEAPQGEAIPAERALAGLAAQRGILDGLLPEGAAARCGFSDGPAPAGPVVAKF